MSLNASVEYRFFQQIIESYWESYFFIYFQTILEIYLIIDA